MAEKTVPEIKKETMPVCEGTRNEECYIPPVVDIYEEEDQLVIVADMPNVAKENLSVKLDQGILTIEGKVQNASEEREYLYQEFHPTSYFRQFEIADTIDSSKISADYKNGVLTLHLPKAEHVKPKQIEVKVEE